MEAWDCVREWDGGVDTLERGDPCVKATDLGRPAEGPGEGEACLEKGLLRGCAMFRETDSYSTTPYGETGGRADSKSAAEVLIQYSAEASAVVVHWGRRSRAGTRRQHWAS